MGKWIEAITLLVKEITANPLHPVQGLNMKIAPLKEVLSHQHLCKIVFSHQRHNNVPLRL
jgi:hypothetical protein